MNTAKIVLKVFLIFVLVFGFAFQHMTHAYANEASSMADTTVIENQATDEIVSEGPDVSESDDSQEVVTDDPSDYDEGGLGETEETPESTPPDEPIVPVADPAPFCSVEYRAHVQTIGWQGWAKDGATSGTTGSALRMEALCIILDDADLAGSVEYRMHVQNIGWQGWVKDGAVSGTTGCALRAEAISIRLTDELADAYDIYYRVHSQSYGWLGWAINGQDAGTTGYSLRMEAIEIRLVIKSHPEPGLTDTPFRKPAMALQANAHVQSIGWQGWAAEGSTSGTTGHGLRMEALCLLITNPDYTGSVEYRTHCASIGWQSWKRDGTVAGTTGQARQMEAIQISLSGEIADIFDVYYRAHIACVGWLDWASNGETAGSVGLSCRMEALQVRLVPKDEPAPGSTTYSSLEVYYTAQANVAGLGWLSSVAGSSVVGTTGQARQMEAFLLSISSTISGGIEYRALVQGDGWQEWEANGTVAGTEGQEKRIEAISIRLTSDMAMYFDVYYRAHCQSIGWLGWTGNGGSAGTDKLNLRLEAFQVVIVPKGAPAPGLTFRSFLDKQYQNPLDVPAISQLPELPTGCEITAVAIMLNGYGIYANKITLANNMPYHGWDPNQGYVGNPYTYSGWTIYPPALMNLVKSYAGSATNLTGCSYSTLRAFLDQGKPVVVWTTMHGFTVHAICLTGYDSSGWYYNDPWTGGKNVWMSQSAFNSTWGSQSWRALSI